MVKKKNKLKTETHNHKHEKSPPFQKKGIEAELLEALEVGPREKTQPGRTW